MRGVRSEIASALTVAAVVALVALSYPYGAVGFRASDRAPAKRFAAALVRLTPEEERDALRVVRTSWRGDGGVRHLRADLFLAELPDDVSGRPVMPERTRPNPAPMPAAEVGWTPFLPSRRAVPPVRSAPSGTDDLLTFPRNELLKLD